MQEETDEMGPRPTFRDMGGANKYNPGTREDQAQMYTVTIVVDSPGFSCNVTGRSYVSTINAHQNALAKLNAPLSEQPLYK